MEGRGGYALFFRVGFPLETARRFLHPRSPRSHAGKLTQADARALNFSSMEVMYDRP